MATAAAEDDCPQFTTDRALYDALTSKNKLLLNDAIDCLKKKFLKIFATATMYRNKWYADDCLAIAIDQFLKYINDGKFTLGAKPVITGLYIFCKRRIIDFEKKEPKRSGLNPAMLAGDDDLYEKMQKENERKKILDNAISLLRDNCRRILRMKYFDELTMIQIAEITQVKPESLYVEISRCKKELKAILIGKFNFPPHGLWI